MRQWFWVICLTLAGCAGTGPQQVDQLNREGVERLSQNDTRGARMAFQQAYQLDPNNVAAIYNLGSAAHQAGDTAQAEQYYRLALERKPNDGPTRHNLILLKLQQGQTQEAWKLADDWRKAAPESADAQAEYGWLLRESGDFPAAQAALQKALQLDSGNVRALTEMGMLYEQFKYPDRARSLYQRVLDREPHNYVVKRRLEELPRR